MKTVLSGIQPSGEMHLGNYLGAVRNYVALQKTHFCYICIVDYHAITQDYDPKRMKSRVTEMAIDLLACGIDPQKAVLFVQSHVREHTELCWVLNSVTSFGDLSRMTQFKDKSNRQVDNINVGLFDYPVLQAADILLYKADAVPVGEDQRQHLELSRRIARAFNRRFAKTFTEPEPIFSSTPKILGLDGKAKMSKSLGNTIPLSAPPKKIRKLIAKAATDPARERRQDVGDPDKCNVFSLHKFFSSDDDLNWVQAGCRSAAIGCVDCKTRLSDNIITHLTPIQEKRQQLIDAPDQVETILAEGAAKARTTAAKTMTQVRKKLGLYPTPSF